MPVQEQYCTSDLDLAAVLVADGHALTAVEKDHRNRTSFVFTDNDDIQRVKIAFLGGTHSVNAAAFVRARRNLLDALHGAI